MASINSNKRDKYDVYESILETLLYRPRLLQTRLQYKCNLSYQMLKYYTKEMEKEGIIRLYIKKHYGKERTHWEVTEKGIKILQEIKRFKQSIQLIIENKI